MAKVEESRAGSWADAAPLRPLDRQLPTSGSSFPKSGTFPRLRVQRRDPCCRRRCCDARLLALHLPWRPQSHPEQPGSFLQPLLLSRLLRLVLLRDGEMGSGGRGKAAGEQERGPGGPADSGAPGKCLNNRMDAAAVQSAPAAGRWVAAVPGGVHWGCTADPKAGRRRPRSGCGGPRRSP